MAISIIPIEILELEKNSYHLFIEAKFSNELLGNLIIDTGASKTIFDKEFVKDFITEYINQEEKITSSGINNAIDDIELVKIQLIQFCELVLQNFETAIMDLSHINTIYQNISDKHIAGLIGGDFLVKYNAQISYKAKHLILEY